MIIIIAKTWAPGCGTTGITAVKKVEAGYQFAKGKMPVRAQFAETISGSGSCPLEFVNHHQG